MTAADGTAPALGSPRSALVIGPGWLGSSIARALQARETAVHTMRRGPGPSIEGDVHRAPLREIVADVTAIGNENESDALDSALSLLPSRIEAIVLCVAPSRARGDTHASTYAAAARGAVRLAGALAAQSLLYTSSTGVYAESGGEWVKETSRLPAGDERQQSLVEAERIVLDAHGATSGSVIVRVSGLYGPMRDPASRFAHGVANGERWCNFAWRDDVVSAVLHLLSLQEVGHTIFNCADGHPVRAGDVAASLGAPDRASTDGASTDRASAERLAGQRVSVARLLATGWAPRVRSIYEGLSLLGHHVSPAAA